LDGIGLSFVKMKITDILKILFLWPFSLLYWLVMEIRAGAYKRGLFKSHKTVVPVISIGNLVAGGTGKTPMAIYVSRLLLDKGLRVAILSRGYGRKNALGSKEPLLVSDGAELKCGVERAGDEPFMMARRLLGTKDRPGAMIIVDRDRVAGAGKAVEMGAQAIILDDGFQHLRLKRDLDIVLLDRRRPFDNGWVLPAGMLREPKRSLKRAAAVIYTRCGGQDAGATKPFLKSSVFTTRHAYGRLRTMDGKSADNLESIRKARILLFSGIARPESFEQSVREAGLIWEGHLKYPDHNHYTQSQLERIRDLSKEYDYLLTTDKDAARFPSDIDLGKPLLVLPVVIEFTDEDGRANFEKMIIEKANRA
jgi:tetraacyldisaccharide 4'-kinase